jgi:antitoxin HicB
VVFSKGMKMKYPARLTPDASGGFVVTFRDIPEAITQGDTESEALVMASDALLTAMDFYFEDNRKVPAPSKAKKGEHLIALALSASAKVLLLNEMIDQQVRPADLARRLATSPQEVNRLINLHHATKIDRLGDAMIALGKEFELIA